MVSFVRNTGLFVLLFSVLLFSVDVIAQEVSPPGAGQPLAFMDRDTLVWEDGSVNGYDTFHVYRTDLEQLSQGNYGDCLKSGLNQNTTSDPSVPPVGTCWCYLVSGEDAGGESTLGYDSTGVKRPQPFPCSLVGSGGFFGAGAGAGSSSAAFGFEDISPFENRPGFNRDGATFRGIADIDEQVDYFNGGLKFNLHLFDLPQNGGMSLPVTAQYNSIGIQPLDDRVNLKAGWKLFFAELTYKLILHYPSDPKTGPAGVYRLIPQHIP